MGMKYFVCLFIIITEESIHWPLTCLFDFLTAWTVNCRTVSSLLDHVVHTMRWLPNRPGHEQTGRDSGFAGRGHTEWCSYSRNDPTANWSCTECGQLEIGPAHTWQYQHAPDHVDYVHFVCNVYILSLITSVIHVHVNYSPIVLVLVVAYADIGHLLIFFYLILNFTTNKFTTPRSELLYTKHFCTALKAVSIDVNLNGWLKDISPVKNIKMVRVSIMACGSWQSKVVHQELTGILL